jgi:hypothetical protein
LIGGNALEDGTVAAIVSAVNNDVPNSGVNYTWSVSQTAAARGRRLVATAQPTHLASPTRVDF